MKTLEKGKDKVDAICKALRNETLEPAKAEAESIIAEAQREAEKIVAAAERHAEEIVTKGRAALQQERSVFESSLRQGAKQSLEALRQDIERKLFSDQLAQMLAKGTSEPGVVAALIKAIVDALGKEGLAADLEAIIPKTVMAQAVNAELGDEILKRLADRTVQVGQFSGGAQVRIIGKKMTIDITDKALKELLAAYVRKDFREIVFGAEIEGA